MSIVESYARGQDIPVLDVTISQLLDQAAGRFPGREALIVLHQRQRLTWSELRQAVYKAAGALRGSGLAPGDRVGVWATNCTEWVLLQYACAAAGVVLVNINPAYRAHELSFVLEKSRIKALFLHERDARADYLAILESARAHRRLELSEVIRLEDWHSFERRAVPFSPPEVSADDVANIQYTSGTTGLPKGVMLTHRNLVNNGRFIAMNLGATEQDRLLVPVPMFHCFGCVIGTMASGVSGAAIIIPSAQFDASVTLRAIHEERPTAIYGVPTMFISWLNHPDFERYDMSSLRTGIMAGAPCPIEVMRRVVNGMHCHELTIAYGQTESSPVITMSHAGDSVETRCTTVGRAMAATEVKIVDREGAVVPIGETGELLTRGYLVMAGYDGDPDATAKAIDAEGWLHTGDLAALRPDGNFKITGRAKDTIIRGGENIYPREIEEYLLRHPAVAEVYVVGLPDEKLGEIVAAWVRVRAGAELSASDIRQFCDGNIAYYKIPQHVRFVTEFPMTANGKIQKYRMREIEIHEMGLEKAARIQTA